MGEYLAGVEEAEGAVEEDEDEVEGVEEDRTLLA